MPRSREATTSFVAGELSPLMAARGDTKIYRNGAAKLTNRAPLVEGGTRTRPGLLHIQNLLAIGKAFKAADFVFSETQAYVAVFTAGRLDIFAHPAAPGAFPVAALTGCPWTEAMVRTLAIIQSDDTMLVFHPDMPSQIVKRTGASSFERRDFAFEQHSSGAPRWQPYYKYAEPGTTLTPGAATGAGVPFTASAPTFAPAHVGAIIRYKKKEILVTGFVSPTLVTGQVRETLPGVAPDIDWDEAVVSGARGWFRSGTFHLDRLVLAGAKSRPSGIFVSKVGAYFNFDIGTGLDSEAMWDSVKDEKVAELRQVLSSDALLVWSDAATFAYFATAAAPFTPKNFEMKKQAPFGVADGVRPVEFDEANLFVQASGAVVRESSYSDADQKFKSTPVSQIASHLIADPTALAVLYGAPGRPEQLALAVNGDGRLSVFHSLRRESIAAWFDWATAGKFKAICTVVDTVYVVVEREIFGGTQYCLERFDDAAAALDCQRKATDTVPTKFFADAAPHLEGLAVAVFSKGHALGRVVVGSGGSVTLGDLAPEVTEIEVGLPFEQRIRPMPVHVDLGDGSGRGLVQCVARMLIVVDRAAGFRVAGQDILLDFQGDDYANPAPTKTGTVEVRLMGYDREGVRDIVVPDGAKATILSVTRDVLVSTG